MDLLAAVERVESKLRKKGLDAFEVMGRHDASLTIEVKQQMVERFMRSTKQGVAIRVLQAGRIGAAATMELQPRALDQLVELGISSMRVVAPSKEACFPPPQDALEAIEGESGRSFADVPDEEKKVFARLLESSALAAEQKVARVQQPGYEEHATEIIVKNSHGVSAQARRSIGLAFLKAIGIDGEEQQSAFELCCAASFDRLDADAMARAAARRAVAKLGARKPKGGTYQMLFDPKAAAAMLQVLMPSFYADNIQRGKSILRQKQGTQMYHPLLTVVDDGLLREGYGTFSFDAEGIPRRRTLLVQEGRVEQWLYDGARAALDGVASTGHAFREELGRQPRIGISNCFVKPGTISSRALMEQMQEGILVTDLLGMHTANTISGDFSVGFEGFMVRNGTMQEPIRAATIAGNVHKLFARIIGISDDLTFYLAAGSPSILVEGIRVGA